MKEYRVTKYNPNYRDANGSYTRDEWTSFRDIGKSVSSHEYEEIETAYIDSALKFLEEQGISTLTITYLENRQNYVELGVELKAGTLLDIRHLAIVLKSILRERYWAKLENDNSFIHVGWDYYMYIGVSNEPKQARYYAESKGLYVENFCSPYKEIE